MALNYQYAIVVNQKLGFARILINNAESSLLANTIPSQQEVHAYLDSACTQLYDAVIYLLLEILDGRHKKEKLDNLSLPILLNQLQNLGENNDLIKEINSLLITHSWLNELQQFKINPSKLVEIINQSNNDQINLHTTASQHNQILASDKSAPKGPTTLINSWLINIQNIVERHRNQALEE